MSVEYTKTLWQDLPSTTSPLSAANLNKIENGIYDTAELANDNESAISGLNSKFVPFKPLNPTTITNGADLNSFVGIGTYLCASNTTVATLQNCPTAYAFRMDVRTNGSKDTGNYVYLIQEIQPYNSTMVYRRKVSTGSTANVWTFGKWETDLGVVVDSFGTDGWTNVENSYFTNSASKVFKQGGWAMVKLDGTINSVPSGWQSIGKVEKSTETVATNVLTNTGEVVRLRVTTSGALQMAYSGEVPAVIGTTFFYPMQVT